MNTALQAINLHQAFSQFSEYWSPKIIGQLNEAHVKLAKLNGEFVWHHHESEDEFFLVIKGRLLIKLRDQEIHLEAGECVIIPHGIEHLPVAEEEVHVLLLEPQSTVNTGTTQSDRTIEAQWLQSPD